MSAENEESYAANHRDQGEEEGEKENSLPSLGEVIERIGFGPAQLRMCLLGGGVWLADGSELLLIGSVSRAVSDEWHMRAWQRGSIVSVVFVGILMGNLIAGPMGDWCGRRLPILLSYVGIAFFSMLSITAPGWMELAAIRLFVGASFGLGQPSFCAMCTECTPQNWRIGLAAISQALFAIGELYSAALVWWDDPMMKQLSWRWLLMMGALPAAFFFVLAFFFLNDSPMYHAAAKQHEKAKEVLESMARDNRCFSRSDATSIEFRVTPPKPASTAAQALAAPLCVIFSRRLVYSTFTIIYSCFTLNLLFYGCLYAFPQVLAENVDMGVSPAVALLLGAFWELPGLLLAAILGIYLPRKPLIMGYLCVTKISLMCFSIGAVGNQANLLDNCLTQGGYMGIKIFVSVGFVAVYQYATEIYPTMARATGAAACVAGGRLGGMLAPLAYEGIREYSGHFEAFFYFMTCLCVLNLFLVAMLPFETFGRSLEEMNETLPIVQPDKLAAAEKLPVK